MTGLIFTILCATAIALLLKHNNVRGGHPLLLLLGNYIVAAILGVYYLISAAQPAYSLVSLGFGLLLGSSFVLSFFVYAKAVRATGAAIATVSARLSVFIPVLLSVLFFNEKPTLRFWLGFLITALTIYLFYLALRSAEHHHLRLRDFIYLMAVFLAMGFNDFAMKVFREFRPQAERPFFLSVIFTTALLITSVLVIRLRLQWQWSTLIRGHILGIPNLLHSVFLLMALAALPAILVYPVANIGIILLTTLLAMIIWKEHLNLYGWLAVAGGAAAIAILSV